MKDGFIKVGAAALPLTVADVTGNAEIIRERMIQADGLGLNLVVFPELCVTGYSCGDLFYSDVLQRSAMDALESLTAATEGLYPVAVIGLPDPRLGEIAAAIIERREGSACTGEEILRFCEELPRYKRPKRIIFAKVPRNPTGKIEKPLLRQRYGTGRLVEAQTTA